MGLNLHCLEIAFQGILFTSLKATLLAMFIWSIQVIFQRKLSARWRCALWGLLLLRLVLPIEIESRFIPLNLSTVENYSAWSENSGIAFEPEHTESTTALEVSGNKPQPVQSSRDNVPQAAQSINIEPLPRNQGAPLSIPTLLGLLWLAGVLGFFLLTLRTNIRFLKQSKRFLPVKNSTMLALFRQCQQEFNIKQPIALLKSDKIKSPMLIGLWRPRILLPAGIEQRLNPTDLKHIFLHELAHYKRKDILVAWLTSILQGLHWFNPMIWFAFYRLRQDRELACDEMSLNHVGQESARAYGLTIINLLSHLSNTAYQALAVGIIENHKNLKRRLAMIHHFHKRSMGWTFAGILLVVVLSGFAFTKKASIQDSPKPYLSEIILEIGNEKVVKFNQETVPVANLAERLNQFRYDENSLIALKTVERVPLSDWFDVQWQLQAVPVQQIKYINNQTGASIVTAQYDLKKLHGEPRNPEGLRPVQKDGKYGYENREKEMIIPPQFDQAQMFIYNRAIVKLNGKWGAIDSTGKIVIPLQYDELHSFHEGLAEFKRNGKWGYLDTNGNIVIEPQFDSASLFYHGYGTVKVGEKDGVINKNGQFIIPPIYERLYHFQEGLIPARQNGKWGYLDEQGMVVIDFIYEQTEMFADGLGLVRVNDRWGYINKKGDFVIQPQYSEANSFQEGLAVVRMANGKYGFIDTRGNIVIQPQFDMAFPFQMGAAMTVIFENPALNIQGQGNWIDKAGNALAARGEK